MPLSCINLHKIRSPTLDKVSFRFSLAKTLMTSSIMLAASSAAGKGISFDDLFWPENSDLVLQGYQIVAHFEDGEFSSYLVRYVKDGQLTLLMPGAKLASHGENLTFIKVSDDGLIFSSQNDDAFLLLFADDHTTAVENVIENVVSDSLSNTDHLMSAKKLALALGFPKLIVDSFNEGPLIGVSRGGRRGWLLGEDIPRIFFSFTPFLKDDIILSVDGISATEVNRLISHVEKKGKFQKFDVEIQRDNKLKLISVYMK